MMLKQATNLLYTQYNNCRDTVGEDKFHCYYAEEKIRHSLQVAGAGNYLIRHIDWLKDKSDEYIEMVKTAVLLHDVCRFSEIAKDFKGIKEKYDHGVAAYEFLNHTSLFDDIRIILPIKHHGHLIGDLYADKEFQNLDDELRREVELICFLVRDADKIANFNMVVHEPYFWSLFTGIERELTADDLKISDYVRQNSFIDGTIPKPFYTIADRVASFLSWYMDINYQAAIDYCDKLGLVKAMMDLFEKYCSDEEYKHKYSAHIFKHLREHKFIK